MSEAKSVGEIAKGLGDRLRKLGGEVRTSLEAFDAWAAKHSVQAETTCGTHGQKLTLDRAASASEFRRGVRRAVYSPCSECLVTAGLIAFGVPEVVCECRFSNYVPPNPADAAACAEVLQWANRIQSGQRGFLVLQSPTFGNGKTHLAVAVMAQVGMRGMRFVSNAEFMRFVRRAYDGDNSVDIVSRCKGASLLVFDDLGVSVGGRDEMPLLHEVFDARYTRGLPSVMTTNLKLGELPVYLGPRMADRMRQAVQLVELTGPSMRPKLRQQYQKGGAV